MLHLRAALRLTTRFRRFCSEAAEDQVKERCRRKNLLEVATFLPERGLGAKFTRLMWIRNGYEDSYWTISKILEKNKGRLRYYGRLTWKGVEDPRERPVKTWQKRGWRYIIEDDPKSTWILKRASKSSSSKTTVNS